MSTAEKKRSTPGDKLKFDECMSLFLSFLRIFGIIPFDGRDFEFLGTRLIFAIFFLSQLTHSSMFFGNIVRRTVQGTVDLEMVCETALVVASSLRYFLLVRRRCELLALIDDCRAIWERCTGAERRTVLEFERKAALLFKLLMLTCVSLNAMYTCTALCVRLPALEANGTERRILPYKWLSNDLQIPGLGYTGKFVLQVFVVQNVCMSATSVDTAAPFLIMISCGYLKVLQDRFFTASARAKSGGKMQDAGSDYLYREFVTCTKLHQSILNLCAKLEELVSSMFLVQVLSTAYNLSLVGIKLAGSDPDRYKFISTMGLCLGQLLICQWPPDFLLTESESVSTAAYFAFVEPLKPQVGRILLLVMARAQRPLQMTAGGIVKLSIESLGSMITGAVSFFTVLRGLKD